MSKYLKFYVQHFYFIVLCNKFHWLAKKFIMYSKTCVKQPPKNRQNKDLTDKW